MGRGGDATMGSVRSDQDARRGSSARVQGGARVGIPAVILAGGLSRRMGGGDKGLLPFGAGTLVAAVRDRVAPQAGAVAINANGDPARFAALGLPVLPDPMPDHPGPLAGVLAAMDWAAAEGAEKVLTVPCDAPFLPRDLLARLAAVEAAVAVATTDGRWHPVAALWSARLAPALREALAAGTRRVAAFAEAQGAVPVPFPPGPPDPFLNVNAPDDLAAAARWL